MSNPIQNFLARVRNGLPVVFNAPTMSNPLPDRFKSPAKNLNSYIAPVQLLRIRADMQLLRDALSEAEEAWYPHRVAMQRIFADTILSGHTLACMTKRMDVTLLRDWDFVDEDGHCNKELKELFDRPWFGRFLKYALQAQFFGYSLVALNDVTDNEFKDLKIIRRWNVSPDRLNVTQFVYSLSGAQFLEEPYKNWHVWVTTPSDLGVSDVGYGLLYNVAIYEILLRNLLGNNADASELYGMPIRVGKTQKSDENERTDFMNAMLKMGSAGAILLDTMDEITLIESKALGQGYKIYSDFEERLEKKISKLILGHSDALDSVPGKLGSQQGHVSPQEKAIQDKQLVDGAFLEDVVNNELVRKMQAIGFDIDTRFRFRFSNNQELIEIRKGEDANNLVTAQIAVAMKNAGLQMAPEYFEERTGIPTSKVTAIAPKLPAISSNGVKVN